jgi:hypothetical protein
MATTRRFTAWEQPFEIRLNGQFNQFYLLLYINRMPLFGLKDSGTSK